MGASLAALEQAPGGVLREGALGATGLCVGKRGRESQDMMEEESHVPLFYVVKWWSSQPGLERL